MKECLLATGFPSHKRHKNPNIHFYHQITLRTHGVRRAGSAALDLCNVASGRFDGFWEFNLNPWDTAAGVLIVEEAGGKVTPLRRFSVSNSTAARRWPRMGWCTRRCCRSSRKSLPDAGWIRCPIRATIRDEGFLHVVHTVILRGFRSALR